MSVLALFPERKLKIVFQFWITLKIPLLLVNVVSNASCDTDFVGCPLSLTVFYHQHCLTCLLPFEKLPNQTYDAEKFFSGESDVEFVLCHKSVAAVTQESIKRGARNLQNRTLDVVTIQRSPFSEVIEGKDGVKSYAGVVFEFLNTIDKKYNFSMKIRTPPDGNWGAKVKGKSWNGMVGMVFRKEVELGASIFSVTMDRARAVHFTVAMHQEPTAILIPAPTEGNKLKQLIKPLSAEVWLGLGISILVIIPTFYALHVWTLTIRWRKPHHASTCSGIVAKVGLYITGSLINQSITSPADKTTRLLLSIWWMVAMVMANTYVAFLVSILSVPELQNTINSLEELSEQDDIQWTFRMGTAHYALFKSETSVGIFKDIGDGVMDEDLVLTDYAGVEKVLTGKWAFLKEKSFLDVALDYDFESQKKCRLTLAKQEFFTVGVGLIVQKRCPFLQLLDYEISTAVSTGLMEKWKYIHWPKQLYCAQAEKYILSTQPNHRKLGLNDVQAAYFILGVGLLTAIVFFLLEFVFIWSRKAIKDIPTKIKARNRKWSYLK